MGGADLIADDSKKGSSSSILKFMSKVRHARIPLNNLNHEQIINNYIRKPEFEYPKEFYTSRTCEVYNLL